jgi:hypothetical protein
MAEHEFWLVQRLKLSSWDPSVIIQSWDQQRIALDYMGSSVIEVDAVSESIQRMRASKLCLRNIGIRRPSVTRTVYFVVDEDRFDEIVQAFREWQSQPRPPSKEYTYFTEHFESRPLDYKEDVVAWWSLDDDVAWTLSSKVADRLLAAFVGETAPFLPGL